MSKKFSKKLKKAFTLVELVIVIAIIAILTSVSVATYFGVTSSAKKSVLTEEATSLKKELQAVSASAGTGDYEKLSWSKANGFTFSTSSETKDVDRLKDLLKEDGLKGTMEEYSNTKDNSIKEIIYSSASYNQIAIIDTTDWNINYEDKPGQGEAIPAQLKNIKDYENGTKIKSRGYFMGGANGNIAYVSSGTNNFRLTGINSSDIASFIPEQTIIEFEGDLNIDKGSDYVDYAYPTYIIDVEKYSSVTKKDNLETPVVYNLNKDSVVELKEDLINAKVNVTDAIVKSFNSPSNKNRSIKNAKINKCFQFNIANSDVDYYLYTQGDTDNQEFLSSLQIGDRFSFSAFVTIYKQYFEFQHITHIEKFSLPSTSVTIKSSKDIATIGETIDLNYDIAPVNSTDKVEFKFANNITSDVATINENKLTILKKPDNGSLEITATITDINGNENTSTSITNKIITVKDSIEAGDFLTIDFTKKYSDYSKIELQDLTINFSQIVNSAPKTAFDTKNNITKVYHNNKITISHNTLNISKITLDYTRSDTSKDSAQIENDQKEFYPHDDTFEISVKGSKNEILLKSITVSFENRELKGLDLQVKDNKKLYLNTSVELVVTPIPANAQPKYTYEILSGADCISLTGDVVTGLKTGTATIKAVTDKIESNILTIEVLESMPIEDSYFIDLSNLNSSIAKIDTIQGGNGKSVSKITVPYCFEISIIPDSKTKNGGFITSNKQVRLYNGNQLLFKSLCKNNIKRIELQGSTLSGNINEMNSYNNTCYYNGDFSEKEFNIKNTINISNIKVFFDYSTISWDNSSIQNGSIAVSKNNQTISTNDIISTGDTIKVIATPDANYLLESITINNNVFTADALDNNTLTYIVKQEAKNLTINANFKFDTNTKFTLSWEDYGDDCVFDIYLDDIKINNSNTSYEIKYGSTIKIKDIMFDDNIELDNIKANNVILTEENGEYSFVVKEDTIIEIKYSKIYKPVNELIITSSKTSIYVNETLQLEYLLEPEDALQTITWSSSDDKIATVDENGLVKGISVGSVKITATTVGLNSEGNQISDEIELQVLKNTTQEPSASQSFTFKKSPFKDSTGDIYLDQDTKLLKITSEKQISTLSFNNNAAQIGSKNNPASTFNIEFNPKDNYYYSNIKICFFVTKGRKADLCIKINNENLISENGTSSLTCSNGTAAIYKFTANNLLQGNVTFEFSNVTGAVFIQSIAFNA